VDIDSKTVNQKICFVLPTYNEEENIENIIELITQEGHNQSKSVFSILVVDDNSSDQTQDIVKRVIDSANNVYLISGQKKGLGDAYKRGFVFAIDSLEADVIFQMDADGQHDTALIPQFLNAIEEGRDVVIGSRYVAGGSLPDFSMFRLLISKIGNLLVRYIGGVIHIKDCTSGYRAIKTSYLKDLNFGYLSTRGYSFQSSLICDLAWRGADILEIPIAFTSRKGGDSKLSLRDQIEFLLNIPKLGFRNMEDFIKYSLVGFLGVGVNLGVYTILTRYFNFSEIVAPLVSIECALILNFFLHNFWTFGNRSTQSRIRVRFLKFHLVSGLAAVINYLVFLSLFLIFGLYDILANLTGIAVAAVFNYLINSNWTWKNNK
jgi:dolichol-phosphate mannosyltransferase|tara:strand:+ start:1358 stop:2485 length:1128 start_codon:yes stop_codon:yes gene_type:complete